MTKTADIYPVVYKGETFRIRIDSEGGLEILEPPIDMEYELAFSAMGGDKTPAVLLTEDWRDEPSSVIAECFWHKLYFPLEKQPLFRRKRLIALDWAEHVMPLYEAEFPAMHKELRAVLSSARNHLRRGSTLPSWKKENIWSLIKATASSAEIEKLWAAFYAVRAFGDAIRYDVKGCADGAATAAAYHSKPSGGWDALMSEVFQAERLWQIRRLIDVTNALDGTKKRKNAAKNWPPLEATR